MRTLLLEDNERSGSLLRGHLGREGYVVDLATTVAEFREHLMSIAHDLYIIDLGLPDGDGIDVVQEVRRRRDRPGPILIVTARTSISDKVAGLDSRADDYLCKPFHIDELLARVRALLRRPIRMAENRVVVGSLILHSATGEIFYNGEQIKLRPSERQLLALLIRRSGRLVPKSLIEDSLKGSDQIVTQNAIEKLVSRLRKSLGHEDMGVNLRTVRGDGYILEAADRIDH